MYYTINRITNFFFQDDATNNAVSGDLVGNRAKVIVHMNYR